MKGPTFEEGALVGDDVPSSWTAGMLSVEEPAFEDCFMDAAGLTKIAKACKKIKSFTYQQFHPEAEDEDDDQWAGIMSKEISAVDARAALLPHKDTLEHFHLEFWRSPWIINGIETYADYCSKQPKLPSLRDFSVLETVFVQHSFLPQYPKFPSAMETLHITDCNSSIREMAGNIAKDVQKGLYPKLREFKVLALDVSHPIKLPGQVIPPNKTPAQCFQSLRDLFKGTKVDFQICPYNLTPPGFDEDEPEYGEEGFPPFHRGPIPPGLMQMLMQRAVADPDFAALVADGDGYSERP
ncbi:uncharacterized protein BDV17DRAFT_258714 [Aspergillus undulatus]|uniref:uncharacterized protein n=1 Tax=Aspergillus undulatus TaxID=1810928 RepID=UPI003CCDB49A